MICVTALMNIEIYCTSRLLGNRREALVQTSTSLTPCTTLAWQMHLQIENTHEFSSLRLSCLRSRPLQPSIGPLPRRQWAKCIFQTPSTTPSVPVITLQPQKPPERMPTEGLIEWTINRLSITSVHRNSMYFAQNAMDAWKVSEFNRRAYSIRKGSETILRHPQLQFPSIEHFFIALTGTVIQHQ